MRIELQLDLETALDLQRAAGDGGPLHTASPAAALRKAVKALGVSLQPVHPGASHPLLAPFFFIDVPDESAVPGVVERVKKVHGVEAAYVRPANEPP